MNLFQIWIITVRDQIPENTIQLLKQTANDYGYRDT